MDDSANTVPNPDPKQRMDAANRRDAANAEALQQQARVDEWLAAAEAVDSYLDGLSPAVLSLVRRITAIRIDADTDYPAALRVVRACNGRMHCEIRQVVDGYDLGGREYYDASFQEVLAEISADVRLSLDIDGLSIPEAIELLTEPERWPTVLQIFDPCGTEPLYVNGEPFITDGRGFVPFDEDDFPDLAPSIAKTYLATKVLVEQHGEFIPASQSDLIKDDVIHVITAWNPPGVHRTPDENDAANERLKAELIAIGCAPLAARGCDPTSEYFEDSWAVTGITDSDAVALGARFDQDAVFRLTRATQSVLACNSEWIVSRSID